MQREYGSYRFSIMLKGNEVKNADKEETIREMAEGIQPDQLIRKSKEEWRALLTNIETFEGFIPRATSNKFYIYGGYCGYDYIYDEIKEAFEKDYGAVTVNDNQSEEGNTSNEESDNSQEEFSDTYTDDEESDSDKEESVRNTTNNVQEEASTNKNGETNQNDHHRKPPLYKAA